MPDPWAVVSHEAVAAPPPSGGDPWAVVSHQPATEGAPTRFLRGAGLPATGEEYKHFLPYNEPGQASLLPQHAGTLAEAIAAPQADPTHSESIQPLEKLPLVGGIVRQQAETFKQPGIMAKVYGSIPLVGPPGYAMGKALESGDYAGAAGAGANIITQLLGLKGVAATEATQAATAGLKASKEAQAIATPPPPPSAAGGVRGAVRSTIGIGERFAQKTAAETVAEHAEATQAVKASNAAAATKHEARVAKVQQRQAALNTETEAANKAAAEEHAQETAKVDEINKAGQEAVGRRTDLSRQITDDSTALGQQVKALEKQARSVGSGKYQVVEQATAGDSVPASDLAEAVNHAKSNIIAGSQESIKQFAELIRKGEPQDVSTSMGTARPGDPLYDILVKSGAVEPTEQLGFRDLQGYYTELGQKMMAQGVSGDVYRALKYVRQQIGNEMQAMAERHGAGDALSDARDYWRQYEQTFHDMRAVSQGGSPVARIVRAEDPGYIAAPVLGKASARTVSMLSGYSAEAAGKAAALARNYNEMTGLPKSFKPKAAPEAPVPQTARQLEMPQPPTPKPEPEPPDVIGAIQQGRAQEVARMGKSMRRISGWDVASVSGGLYQIARGELPTAFGVTALRHGLGAVLEHPRVAQWLSAPTAADFAALEKIGDAAQRETIRNSVAAVYEKRAAEGRPLQMNQAAKDYLGIGEGVTAPAPPPISSKVGGAKVLAGDVTLSGPVSPVAADITRLKAELKTATDPKEIADIQQALEHAQARLEGRPYTPPSQAEVEKLPAQQPREYQPPPYNRGEPVQPPRQIQTPRNPAAMPPSGRSQGLQGPERAAAITAVMSQLKRGEISEADADRQIQRLSGGGGRKLIRFPQQPGGAP